ncbi:MAG: prepilin peptidase [Alphaproteobacteria bacterium]|nr:prepilin peptidase [Alphaproteobacteria bacterium]
MSRTRSECPSCGKILGVSELVPLFSWLVQRGKCKGCGTSIPLVYPLIELGCVMAALGVWAVYGLSSAGVVILLALPFLMALLAADLEHMILPNTLVAALLAVGGLYHGLSFLQDNETADDIIGFVFSGLIYGGLFWALGWGMQKAVKRDALGMGDVKFAIVAGFWLGLSFLPAFCLLAGLGGVVLGLFWRFCLRQDVFPFGPSLILAFYLLLLWAGGWDQLSLFSLPSL